MSPQGLELQFRSFIKSECASSAIFNGRGQFGAQEIRNRMEVGKRSMNPVSSEERPAESVLSGVRATALADKAAGLHGVTFRFPAVSLVMRSSARPRAALVDIFLVLMLLGRQG
jgi:hypothetical protein